MKFEDYNIYFNQVVIIQSLQPKDAKTGTELYEDVLRRLEFKLHNFRAELINVESKSELFEILYDIERRVSEKKSIPLLHFEAHGTKEGLWLAGEEEVTWEELIVPISRINSKCGNNLFLSIAACWGGNIQFQIDIARPSPFRGFIGPFGPLSEKDVISSFVPFFEALLDTDDFHAAIEALKRGNADRIEFHHLNSEAFFDFMVETYQKALNGSDIVVRKRVLDALWNAPVRSFISFNDRSEFDYFVISRKEDIMGRIESLRDVFLHRGSES